MDFNAIAEFFKKFLLEYWQFLTVAFILGMVAQFFKQKVWTKERTARSRFCRVMRITLPLHSPVLGIMLGLGMVLGLGLEGTPRPAIADTPAAVVLLYAGAGVLSSWIFGAFKHLMDKKGIKNPLDEVSK